MQNLRCNPVFPNDLFIYLFIYDPAVSPQMATCTDARTRGHSQKLARSHCRTKRRADFFTNRIISPWNSLPQHVIDAQSVSAFERRLDKHWNGLQIKYNFEAQLDLATNVRAGTDVFSEEELDIQE